MKTLIENLCLDEERALYGMCDAEIRGCRFEGDADGESALKEGRNITVSDCDFTLRYPLWHNKGLSVVSSRFGKNARAPMWYSSDGVFKNCHSECVKMLRECDNISFDGCHITSEEFGWKCKSITVRDSYIDSSYLFLDSVGITCEGISMKGKYSFQYVKDLTIKDSILDTKDAFWHSENVRVENCTVKGEYLGWFSKGLTLINCKISGTQPLCYCEDLTLIDCTMDGCDLSFEYSCVDARIIGHIDSVKNVRGGVVTADSVGEIINSDAVMECTGKVIVRD